VELVVSGPLIVHDYPSMLDVALAGVALAQIPAPVAQEHIAAARLKEVLHRYAPSSPGVFLYFPDRRQVSPKLRAFIDHVRSRGALGSSPAAKRASQRDRVTGRKPA